VQIQTFHVYGHSQKLIKGSGRGLYAGDTGIIRFGARDYDPDTGRWTAKDPILFNGGDSDLYEYCLNDPVNLYDEKGLWVIQAVGTALGAGINAYNNYGAYRSGQISGKQYAESIAVGAATGFVSSLGGGIITGALLGGTSAAANNVFNQSIANPCAKIMTSGKAGGLCKS